VPDGVDETDATGPDEVATTTAPDEVAGAGPPDEVSCPLTVESAINTMNAIRKRILNWKSLQFEKKGGDLRVK